MKVVSTEEMRALDRRTIEEFETPGEVLMDRAGRGVADVVAIAADSVVRRTPSIHMFAGRGNNGGDVFAAARYLVQFSFDVVVWLVGSRHDVRGDSLKHLQELAQTNARIEEVPLLDQWQAMSDPGYGDVLVDGILGTGLSGPPRGPAAGAIDFINATASGRYVVAIDVPSGLNADTGEAMGDTVRADMTVTMGLPKRGLLAPAALDYVGNLDVVDIGIPRELTEPLPSELQLITLDEIAGKFGRRRRASHKGDYGHLLILAGSARFSGAASLTARAACRSGAGLVTAIVPKSIASAAAAVAPEAMVYGVAESARGGLTIDALEEEFAALERYDAIVVGPGLGNDDDTAGIVERLLECCRVPLALDADALNVLQGRSETVAGAKCPVLVTPHPGEMARLCGTSSDDVQNNRIETARRAAETLGALVILKGAGTIVTQSGESVWINMTGNPGMACGGMGDVLSGLLGGLLAQGLTPLDAARAAVYLHGRAGDIAAWSGSQPGMTAGDVVESLPIAFRDVTPR